MLDDGRLTDGQGRTVDFRNTVLIMTSNIRSPEQMREHFRPEFLNRIDEIVQFEALGKEQLGEIAELQLARLRERLAERGLGLELTDAAKELLAEVGWDPTYGARPLKRAIQRLVENPLALRLLEGEFARWRHDPRRRGERRAHVRAGRSGRASDGVGLKSHLAARCPGHDDRRVAKIGIGSRQRDGRWHHFEVDVDRCEAESILEDWRSPMKRKRMTPEERRAYEQQKAEWAQEDAEFRAMVARRAERLREWDEYVARRRARLRRLTFGLLGR